MLRFGYVVFDTIEVMEEQLKEKQGGELEGMQLFLDYTNDKSSHINMAKKGLRGFSKSSNDTFLINGSESMYKRDLGNFLFFLRN